MTFNEWRNQKSFSIGFIANTLAEPRTVVALWDQGVKFPKSRAKLFQKIWGIDPLTFEYRYEEQK